MSQNFDPPGLTGQNQTPLPRVEIIAPLVDGGEMRWDGEFAAGKLAEYEALAAAGGLAGWHIIHELLSDDWGPPPRAVQFFEEGKMVASIPYDRPKRPGR
jgi:hypothetical protein